MGLGISQEELSERAGMHRTYITDIEAGRRNPSLESIQRLAKALEVSVGAIFSTIEESQGAYASAGMQHAPGRVRGILLVEDSVNDIELTLEAFKAAQLANPVAIVRDGAEALDYLFCRGA